MGKIISIVNQKGGVGKTTTSINLGASLAILEHKTLIIDADPQANATAGLGFNVKEINHSIYECILGEVNAKDIILKAETPNLYILPAHIDLVGAELEMVNLERRESRMCDVLNQIKNEYDFILIDCAPSLGLITLNALVGSDSVIIPVQSEYFALEGLGKLLNTIRLVQQNMNPNLNIEGILLTMYDSRLKGANTVVDDVKQHCKDLVFETLIYRNTRLSESQSYGLPVIMYDAQSRGAVNYLNLARELLKNNQKSN